NATTLHATLTPTTPDTTHLTITDPTGTPVLTVGSLHLRAADLTPSATAADPGLGLFRVDWQPVATPPEAERAVTRAVLGQDVIGVVAALGGDVPLHEDLDALLAAGPVPEEVLFAVSPGRPPRGTYVPVELAKEAPSRVLKVLQQWLADERFSRSRLVVVTRNAVSTRYDETIRDQSLAVWGLVRTAEREHPGRFLLVDVDRDEASHRALGQALTVTGENQLALRHGAVLAARLGREAPGGRLAEPAGSANWRLGSASRGTLDHLALLPAEDPDAPLGPGEVRVGIRAVGLNFRDVLIALGQYPGEAPIASEGAGYVLATGPGVDGFAPGDRVMGLFESGAGGPVAVTDQRLLTGVPGNWSFTQAAGAPVVFLTALYALHDLGDYRAGQTALVHSAAGGVGMAAAQLARARGLEVYGTASPAKWDALRYQGFDDAHLANSRTLEFEQRILDLTGGRGVDLVLDALVGEFVDASLRLLPRGGRFLEMGKADIRDPEQVAREYPGVVYRAFDLMEAGPDRIAELLAELSAGFESGQLLPLPVEAWDVHRAGDAFRQLRQSRHVGKVVLTLAKPLDRDGTVLITGGTGTLGGLLARHLVTEHGVRHLLLTSRRGPDAPGAAELAAGLSALGAEVEIVAADPADREAAFALVGSVGPEHPLTAVIHAAGVLDDGTIESMTPERLDTVARPKQDAAWHLTDAVRTLDLSALVLFSSFAGVLGNPGQSNYAATNSFLDGLAAYHRSNGIPGVSLAWGLWGAEAGDGAGGGMAGALDGGALSRLAAAGFAPLAPEQGLALFDQALDRDEPLLVPLRLDLAGLRARAEDRSLAPLLRGLVRTPLRRPAATARAAAGGGGSLADRLREVDEAERDRLLLTLVRAEAAAVLGHGGAESVGPERAFKDLGFDSLTSVELRNRINSATGLRMPSSLVFDHPTPAALAGRLRTELLDEDEAAPVKAVAVPSAPVEDDPIAIVGMACRFAGAVTSPEELWRLVAEGRDGITDFPENRGWDTEALYDPDPQRTGTSYTRRGAFLTDADRFDAAFFGINPREATAMDPQQRLLLETAWEAVERAGIDPTALRGSDTGVFAGVVAGDYVTRLGHSPESVEGYLATGTTASVASGRIAYTLGLEGPAVSVDTACSSSLVALHLAAQSLRAGECSLALAGGATVLSGPTSFVEFSRQRALSADGVCKAFSDDADGTGWGEGAGLLLLERLSDARRNGHPVLALIRGTATNQDGASNGLTAPNGPSQERVIRQALANARLTADQVDAVEAHGTGTKLGDPIEAQALLNTYGRARDAEHPLWLGSLKTNVGHTMAAAGVGGVIKMVMAMRHATLPRTLHVSEPTSHVDWSDGTVRLLTEAQPWHHEGDRPRRAAVSSFGISGTNAHVILEQPVGDPEPATGTAELPLLLSARSAEALREQAGRLTAFLAEQPEARNAAVARALAARTRFDHRAVVLGQDRESQLAGLRALADGVETPGVVTGSTVGDQPGRAVFVFPGQGSQWAAMGRELLDSDPEFARYLGECAEALAPHTDWDLLEVLTEAPGAPGLDRVDVVQPALFAMMVSLAKLWRHHGVEPAAVIGHSQGEIAAAHLAGALSLADAARIAALRSRAITRLAGTGGMLSVQAPAATVAERLAERLGKGLGKGEDAHVAAVNGPAATVVSGAPEALAALRDAFEADGVRARLIPVDYASHSPHVDTLEEELRTLLAATAPTAGDVPFYSAVTTEPLAGTELDGAYWFRNLREPVRFEETVRRLLHHGHTAFIEVSPHPVLTTAVQETIEAAGAAAVALGTLRRDQGGPERFALSLAEAHVSGTSPAAWAPAAAGAAVPELPTYPFQRERHWLEATHTAVDADGLGLDRAGHALLGASVPLADGDQLVLTGRISVPTHPWLADHAVEGTVLLPGTAFVDLALHAAELADPEAEVPAVEDLVLEAPLVLAGRDAVTLQVSVGAPEEGGRRPVGVHSRTAGAPGWTRHAAGFLAAGDPTAPGGSTAPGDLPWPPPGTAVDLSTAYDELAAQGYAYGPVFQGLTGLWRDGTDLYAEVTLPEDTDATGHTVHPALLDAALHALALGAPDGEQGPRLPFSFAGLRLHGRGATALRVRLARAQDGTVALSAADASGAPVAELAALALRPVTAEQLAALRAGAEGGALPLHTVEWTALPAGPAAPAPAPGAWTVLGAPAVADLLGAPAFTDLAALRTAVEDGATPVPEVVVTALPPLADSGPEETRAALGGLLALLRSWLDDERFAASRLVPLVPGGAVGDADAATPAAAALWGLLRTARTENPDRLVLVDLDPADEAAVLALPTALASGESELAVRAGTVSVPRLAAAPAQPAGHPWAGAADGTVLITGATGTLGALVARHLVTEHGVRHLLLTGRRGSAAPGATELAEELAESGAEVRIEACDASDRDALGALLATVPATRPLTAVVHAAGALDDGVLQSLTPERLATVLAAKADAARHLHELTRDAPLSAFVLFSSLAGVIGAAGQANYAAANAYLDGLARLRRSLGLAATSVAWGLWADASGLTGHLDARERDRMGRTGVAPLSTEDGLDLFDRALRSTAPALVAARLDTGALHRQAAAGLLPPLFGGLVRRTARRGTVQPARSLAERLAAVPQAQRERLVLDLVRDTAALVLGHADSSAVDDEQSFKELGFDSLTAVEFRNRLNAATGVRLPATVVFDHPSPAALAARLLTEAEPARSATPAPEFGGSALAGLDALEKLLVRTPEEDPATRAEIGRRLRELLRGWESEQPGGAEADVASRIQSASAAEILDLIDSEFRGKGGSR
ncbi:SDR family NAD(P)-dependent oxidoreductase, partial [Kitasatospora sp. NPDC001132]